MSLMEVLPGWMARTRKSPMQAEMSEVTGDRLATVMVYLESVAAGGATAFPNTGVMVPVTRGAAAFWVNLRTSGTIDRYTLDNRDIKEHSRRFTVTEKALNRGNNILRDQL